MCRAGTGELGTHSLRAAHKNETPLRRTGTSRWAPEASPPPGRPGPSVGERPPPPAALERGQLHSPRPLEQHSQGQRGHGWAVISPRQERCGIVLHSPQTALPHGAPRGILISNGCLLYRRLRHTILSHAAHAPLLRLIVIRYYYTSKCCIPRWGSRHPYRYWLLRALIRIPPHQVKTFWRRKFPVMVIMIDHDKIWWIIGRVQYIPH